MSAHKFWRICRNIILIWQTFFFFTEIIEKKKTDKCENVILAFSFKWISRRLRGALTSRGGNIARRKRVLWYYPCVCGEEGEPVWRGCVSVVRSLFMYLMHHLFNTEIQNGWQLSFRVWDDFCTFHESGGFCTLMRRTSGFMHLLVFFEKCCVAVELPFFRWKLVFFSFLFFFLFHVCLSFLFRSGTQIPTVNNQDDDCWVKSQVFFLCVAGWWLWKCQQLTLFCFFYVKVCGC